MDIQEIDNKYLQVTKTFLEYRIRDDEIITKALTFYNNYFNLVEHPFTLEDIDKIANIDFSLKMDFLHWTTINPKTPEEINKFYRNTPYEFFKNLIKNMDIMHYHILIRDILPRLRDTSCKTVLNYGGGSGYLEILLTKLGFKVTFSEINKISLDWIKYINQELKLDIKIIDLQDSKIEENYDMIIIKDVLEHITNPEEVINELQKKTKNLVIIPYKLDKKEDYLPMHFNYEIRNG